MSTMSTLSDVLNEVRAIQECLHEIHLAQPAESRSSVQVNTSTRGWDITVKAYHGSPVEEAGNAAVSEYLRVRQMLEDALMGKGQQAA